ncbi:TriL protein [Francisella philomiragia]|uniref:TriL protein n=1 Tax=Francisella philomiragia TaxID=28110 RepID=A0ABS1GEZ9_9GAMM|nr:TriL protein [Francisella philomiragia]MBK2259551.1 TriL protein [Francisella philomiragia]MBK2266502.1 TriL protein [Francisella philomiragia]MBK2278330.1 TriL protein [Francisella philomiragia]MBK2286186.1 TriL protein [Francisella philomiragia]MBK2287785.1 TriL protein [Francisella philomiragia]
MIETRGRKDLIEQGQIRVMLALDFLADEVYTNRQILKEVTGITSSQGIGGFIKRLEKLGFAREINLPSVEEPNKTYKIIGITSQGMAEANHLDRRGFELSKLKHSQLLHKFLCQQIHLQAIKQNHKYISGRWLTDEWFGGKNVKRPDAIIITQDNQKIAIEAERIIKSKYRYQQIIVQYLKMIKASQISKVRYVMPDQAKAQMVEKAIKSIKSVTVSTNGQKRQFNLTDDVWKWFEFVNI